MYRIALIQTQATPNRAATWQYIQDNNSVFETEDIDIALDRYERELFNYKRTDLKLLKIIDIIVHLEGIDLCPDCGQNHGCQGGSGTVYDPDVPLEGAYSYNNLADKPTLNNVLIKGNLVTENLGLQEEMEEYTNEEIEQMLSTQG